MPSFHTLTVVEELGSRPGLQRLLLNDHSRAFALTQLVGDINVGDEVVVNTTAVDLGLGTGGWHVVQWNLARRELLRPGAGHIMKLRYTGSQLDTGAAEEVDGLISAGIPDLGGTPVLVGSLHSQVGVAAAVLHHLDPSVRVSYVMTDGAALPLVMSDLVAELRSRSMLTGTITAGHAFGGDLEAVNVASALQLAVEVQRAGIVICAMGPGVVGTGTALGTTAVEVAAILTVAHQLRARPVMMVRASSADPRQRHLGISHHSRTALALTPVAVDVACVPELIDQFGAIGPHRVIGVDPPDVVALLERAGLEVTTMGRGPRDDEIFFRTVASAATHAMNVRDAEGTVCAK
jgi:hypothetical protein